MEGNPKAREQAKVGDQEGKESTTTVCGDGDDTVARGNKKAAAKFWRREKRKLKISTG
jgi:hypothetical protein